MRKAVRTHILILAAIAVATVVCHLTVLDVPFVWDDSDIHVDNPHMQRSGSLLRYFDLDYWRESHSVLKSPYRPIREIILGGLRRVFGPNPLPFHAVSLAGHALNAMLVYMLAVLLLKQRLPAFIAAMVFALHPSHIEVLAFSKNVGEVVCVFFGLLALIAMMRYVHRFEYHDGTRWWMWLAAAVVCFGLGLLTKESVLAVPFIVSAWMLLTLRPPHRRPALLGTIPLWVMLAVYLVLQIASKELAGRAEMAAFRMPPGMWWRFLIIVKTVLSYLAILVFPAFHIPWHDFRLTGGEPAWMQVGMLALALGIALLWLRTLRRWWIIAFALFWIVIALGPASNVLVNTGRPLAEQRMYLSTAGFGLLAAALLMPLLSLRRLRGPTLIAVAGVCLLYGLLQMHGLDFWRTERTLWVKGIRHAPGHPGPHKNLANVYIPIGHLTGAVAEFQLVRDKDPDHVPALMSLGGLYGRMGRFDEAMKVLNEARRKWPDDVGVFNNLGTVSFRHADALLAQGKKPEARKRLVEAIGYFDQVCRLAPHHVQALNNLGSCYLNLGDMDKAATMYDKALAIAPEFTEALYNRARISVAQGKLREALATFTKAARINPLLPRLFNEIAGVHERLKDDKSAEAAWLASLRQAARLNLPPQRVLLILGRLAATQERLGKRAAAHASWQRAAHLVPNHPDIRAGLQRTKP